MKDLHPDFVDFLKSLADHEVDFVVVGGYAVAFYGHARATKDIDVLVRSGQSNAKKLYGALADFGAPLSSLNVRAEDLSEYGGILQLGVPPQRIDVINQITGVSYDQATANVEWFELEGRRIRIIGFSALIDNKRAVGRPQDIADVAALTKSGRGFLKGMDTDIERDEDRL